MNSGFKPAATSSTKYSLRPQPGIRPRGHTSAIPLVNKSAPKKIRRLGKNFPRLGVFFRRLGKFFRSDLVFSKVGTGCFSGQRAGRKKADAEKTCLLARKFVTLPVRENQIPIFLPSPRGRTDGPAPEQSQRRGLKNACLQEND